MCSLQRNKWIGRGHVIVSHMILLDRRRFGLQRPFLYSQEEQVGPDKWYPAILFFAVPIRERYSRLLTSLDKVPGQDGAPAWKMHMVNQE